MASNRGIRVPRTGLSYSALRGVRRLKYRLLSLVRKRVLAAVPRPRVQAARGRWLALALAIEFVSRAL